MSVKTVKRYSIKSGETVSELMEALSSVANGARIISIGVAERNVNDYEIPAGSKTIYVTAELEVE